MLKGQDIVVLLALVGDPDFGTTVQLAKRLSLSGATTHRGLHSLDAAGLYDRRRRRVPEAAAEEFLRGSETRGVPAAWAAAPLLTELSDAALPPVWPHPSGDRRGVALEPLHPVVPEVARHDEALGERLALLDAIRAGDARIRRMAEAALVDRLREATR